MYNKSITQTDENGFVYSVDKAVINFELPVETCFHSHSFKCDKQVEHRESASAFKFFKSFTLTNSDSKSSIFVGLFMNVFSKAESVYIEEDEDGNQIVNTTSRPCIVPTCKCMVEFNPNKLSDKDILTLVSVLKAAENPFVHKIDFAVDIPIKKSLLHLLHSSKEKYVCLSSDKGATEYVGVRGKDGYTKLYDKKLESGLDQDLTRYEVTMVDCNDFKQYPNRCQMYDIEGAGTPTDKALLFAMSNLEPNIREEMLDYLEIRKKRALIGVGSSSPLAFDSFVIDAVLLAFANFITGKINSQIVISISNLIPF